MSSPGIIKELKLLLPGRQLATVHCGSRNQYYVANPSNGTATIDGQEVSWDVTHYGGDCHFKRAPDGTIDTSPLSIEPDEDVVKHSREFERVMKSTVIDDMVSAIPSTTDNDGSFGIWDLVPVMNLIVIICLFIGFAGGFL